MATKHRSLAVTACEWRAYELADPEQLADAVFDQLLSNPDPNLTDFYQALDVVIQQAYLRHAAESSILDRMNSSLHFRRTGIDNEIITALSQLRRKHRELLQLRYWDGLSEVEAVEALQLSPQAFPERQAKAEARFRRRLAKHGSVSIDEPVGVIIAGAKPGTHHRNPS